MSRIDKLIARLCPNGVELRNLGDIVTNHDSRRKPVTRGSREAGEYPYYGANGIQDWVSDYIYDGTFLLVGEDGSVVTSNGKPVLKWASGKIWVNNHAHVLTARDDTVELRFLYFYLGTVDISPFVTGGTQPKLNQGNMNRIRIAVPPVAIQREVVRILDTFTALETELQAELDARRLQYAHYRDRLLTFPEAGGVRMVQMGEALSLRSGKFIAAADIQSQQTPGFPYPCFGGNGIRGFVAEPSHDGDFVIIGRQGAWSGNVKRATGKFYATEHAVVVTPIEEFSTSWLFHELTAMNLNQYVSAGAQPGLAVGNLNRLVLPVADIDQQIKAAEILDRFDTLANSLSEGLPAELRARRQQYEYYRDKLLAFEEAAA